MQKVIISDISKSYSANKALDSINAEINENEIFGFIGPDGAGKTTLFRLITTLLLQDSGSISVFGLDTLRDIAHIRKIIGYMPGKFSLYEDLTVEENLNFFASIFGTTVNQNIELVKEIYTQIEPFKHRRAGKLSGGMKQKLALSCALIHKPKLLVLDEPTTGVDAVSRKEFWEMLRRLKNRGITIIVATPYMDEAILCSKVALIQSGKILSIDTPSAIIEQYPFRLFAVKSNNIYKLISSLRNFQHTNTVYPFGEYLHYTDKRPEINTDILALEIQSYMNMQVEVKEIQAGIEDSFMHLMEASAND